jgi:gluconolactonase
VCNRDLYRGLNRTRFRIWLVPGPNVGAMTSAMNVELVASGLQFPEGPVAMPDGSIVLVEIKAQRITRVRPKTAAEGGGWHEPETAADMPASGPNGAALGPDGALYVADNGGSFEWHERNGMTYPGPVPATWTGGRIARVDLATGSVTTFYDATHAPNLRAPNDLVMDGHGGFWFTDHGTRNEHRADRTALYYARCDGSEIREVLRPVDGPNGIGLSPDGSVLYWAETHTGRVYHRPVTAPGVLGPAGPLGGVLAGLPGMQLLDSMAIDAEGNVCVATIVNGGITVVSPTGDHHHVRLPEPFVDPLTTNICFGGPDMKTAFITLSGTGRLVAVHWPTAGLRLPHC